MTEAALRQRIVTALRAEGCYVLTTTGVVAAGTPDLLVCREGRFIALEIKVPGNYATARQRHELLVVRRAGGRAEVVKSVAEALNAVL